MSCDTLHIFYKYKNIIISQNIPSSTRQNQQLKSNNYSEEKGNMQLTVCTIVSPFGMLLQQKPAQN